MLNDTIAAVATPRGRGGIGVLRMSGPRAMEIARTVVRGSRARALVEPNVASVVDILDSEDPEEHLDRAILTTFRSPNSFTGEDVVEISCHGSPFVLEAVLGVLLRAGARAATPGEFTLRAFVNRRIDLVQAEAVRDLVDAQSMHQARRAQRQMRGELSLAAAPLKERLVELIVQLESHVEFVEDDIAPAGRSELAIELRAAAGAVAKLADSYRLGRLVREGIAVALVGPPNVGKSSLFNRLLERERAIVTPIAGTTRDLVSERLELGGIPIRLVDTAGLRDTVDAVERIGVERTRSAIADADLSVIVIDNVDTGVGEISRLLELTDGLPRIVVFNKCDLAQPQAENLRIVEGITPSIVASALTGDGIDEVRSALLRAVCGADQLEQNAILVTNARHHALLVDASARLGEASAALDAGFSEEVALVGLHAALRDLGELTGETVVDDILDRIFSTFCIGK